MTAGSGGEPRKPCSPAAAALRRAKALCRHQGPHDKLGRDRDHLKTCPAPSSWSATASRKPARNAPGWTAWCIRQRHRLAVGQLGTDGLGSTRWAVAADPGNQCLKERPQRLVDVAARDKLTVRQLAQRVGGYGGLAFVGTPALIAVRWRSG